MEETKLTVADESREKLITDAVCSVGITANLKGYAYIRTSVDMVMENPEIIYCVTKLLYPEVAKKYGTTAGKVERNIRNAIEIAWNRGASSEISSLFGYNPDMYSCRPTNSEFIALISDKLRLKLKSQRGKIMGI